MNGDGLFDFIDGVESDSTSNDLAQMSPLGAIKLSRLDVVAVTTACISRDEMEDHANNKSIKSIL